MLKNWFKIRVSRLAVLALLAFVASCVTVQAGTDATAITTAAETAWASVASLCVLIGTFVVVYRLVRKVR